MPDSKLRECPTPSARRWRFSVKAGRATSDPEKMVTPAVLYASKTENDISVQLLALGWWDWHISFLVARSSEPPHNSVEE